MESCNAYESRCMSDVMGHTLRPGEFRLTKRAVEFCHITSEHKILDLGCGMGASIGFLYRNYNIKAVGIDPSEKLLGIARENCPSARFLSGTGDFLPFDNESFDFVLAECTLSLMNDIDKTLREVRRVLKNGGWFAITDVYAKKPDEAETLQSSPVVSCMRGLHDLEKLQRNLTDLGFHICILEDCSDLLKELMVKIIFQFGSMDVFWNKAAGSQTCETGTLFQQKIKQCKPGYFLLICRKDEYHG